ncbi:MAG: leucyl aminopeptidase family protein [Myxococcota bacterium]
MPSQRRLVVLAVGKKALQKPSSGAIDQIAQATDLDILELAKDEDFQADIGQEMLFRGVHGLTARNLLLVGFGDEPAEDGVRKAGIRAARVAHDLRTDEVALPTPAGLPSGFGLANFARIFAEGFHFGNYRFDKYLTRDEDDDYDGVESITILFQEEGVQDELDAGRLLGDAVSFARDLVNEPAMDLTPGELASRAAQLAEELDLEATIFDGDGVQDKGFNLIWAVGKGSDNPPHLIHLVYRPEKDVKRRVAFVGKGVTFDTGGYSMKQPVQMQNMHVDMAGAAAVLGAAHAIGRLGTKHTEVHFIVPTAENSVSGRATRPQDIVRGYGDKTVQILNTDAEGRLILADALAYAQEQDVDTIVDLATLTGSSVIALGEYTSALFSNDDELAEQLLTAGESGGDDLWRMPLTPAIDKQLDTPFADMKNIGKREGGAISAALFLKRWVDMDRWAHLDIAGPSLAGAEDKFRQAGATGVGVGTLVKWVQSLG